MPELIAEAITPVANPEGQLAIAAAAQAQPEAPPVVETQQETQIPEKFRGKTFEDVLKAYSEIEKVNGKLTSENHEVKTKATQYEQMLQQQAIQPHTTQPIASQPVRTLEDEYNEEWEKDPKAAVINYQKRNQDRLARQVTEARGVEFYNQAKSGQIKGYEDFAELEPTMMQIVPYFSDVLNPAMLSHPKVVAGLHLMARGLTREAAIAKARTEGSTLAKNKQSQKEKAFSESSSSAGADTTDFSKLSLSEMKKLLPRAAAEE